MEISQEKNITPRLKTNTSALDGLGVGLFALIAGGLLFAEQFGLLLAVKWFWPLVLLIFGIVTILRAVMQRK